MTIKNEMHASPTSDKYQRRRGRQGHRRLKKWRERLQENRSLTMTAKADMKKLVAEP
jgi:hypothetical protein